MIDLASACESLREIVIINNEEHFARTGHISDFPSMGPMQTFIGTARNAIIRQRLPQLSKFLICGRKNSPWEADELTLGYHWSIDLLHNKTTVWPHINCVPPKVWDKADGTQAYWMRYQEAPGSKILDIADLSSNDGITRLIDGSSWSKSSNTGIELPSHQVKSRDDHEWLRDDISIMLERSEQLKAYPPGHCHDLWFWEKCLGRRLIDVQFLDGTTLPDCPKREQPPAEKELVEMMARTSQFGDVQQDKQGGDDD
ncbi:hypothetical protein LTR05_008013 [Lithohypha guttulata]|uniref:Uncharacterized protein n=1 Tax=Lithohypha guttulata TaxID=1690604 RepID=A0AAN7STM9_9EURO|nr:hypothetical protein LTR05_008013 [Lithohypha guttulata]